MSTKRRKRTWEEASDNEDMDPEATEAARKEAEMEADRSVIPIFFAVIWVRDNNCCAMSCSLR